MSNFIKSYIFHPVNQLIRRLKFRKTPKYSKGLVPSVKILNGVIAYNEYGGYCTPVSSQSRFAVQKILRGKVYEPDTIKYMRTHCGEGDIVHAGTFFGDFLPGLSSALGSEAKIWAFEPNPENFRCAQITASINQLDNVNLMNAGLGSEPAILEMLVETETGVPLGGGSTFLKSNKKGKTVEVKIVKIDDIVPKDRTVAIIQLDVEGFEEEALKGAIETIHRCEPIIILENNQLNVDSAWFVYNISNFGYRIVGKLHHNFLLIKE